MSSLSGSQTDNLPDIITIIKDLITLCEENHNRLNALETAFNKEISSLLEAVSRINHRQLQTDIALEDPNLAVTVQYLLGRIEFVRRELMYELRYHGKHSTGSTFATQTRVMNPDKLAEAKKNNKVQLNLGCGNIPLPEYLNVDIRELPGVDILAEADSLPFSESEVDVIFSSHFLEHFPQEQLRRVLLPYWYSLLKPGGEFRAVVPDGEAMILEFQKGRFAYKDLREALYGAQDYQGDFHFNLFMPEYLSELLIEAGFQQIEIIQKGRPTGSCLEFEISARHI